MALVEERLKAIEAAIAELKDLQSISKLDIINLKNAIEQAKLGIILELPKIERVEKAAPKEKIQKIQKIEEKPGLPETEIINLLSKIGELQTGLEDLRNQVDDITIPKIPDIKDVSADIRKINRQISRLNTATERLKAKKIRIPKPKISKAVLEERLKEIMVKDIEKGIKADISSISKRLDSLEKKIKENGSIISRIQKQIRV